MLLSQFLSAEIFPDSAERVSYADIFQHYTGLNALQFNLTEYQRSAEKLGLPEAQGLCENDHPTWLDFLFSHIVQPHLGISGLCMVYDYPACLPSLARLKPDNSLLVDRVEVFIQGIELGNGYYELQDVEQQNSRFEQEILLRKRNGATKVHKDERLLAALESGLPDCSGIAIGLDRLLMVISQKKHITEVLAFPIENA